MMTTPDPQSQRVQRLEEAQAFTEHTIDQLAAELLATNERLAELARRLARLESTVLAPKEDDEPSDADET